MLLKLRFYLLHFILSTTYPFLQHLIIWVMRAAFLNSEEIQKFHSCRTKTTAIVKTIASEKLSDLVKSLKMLPYSIATDGSHTSDSKLYPVLITYPDNQRLLGVNFWQFHPLMSLNVSSSGENIAGLLIKTLEEHGIPIKNCMSLGSDNASVMLGKNTGVIAHLRNSQPNMISIGYPCHLINLAAHHAFSELPISIDSLLIDFFFIIIWRPV